MLLPLASLYRDYRSPTPYDRTSLEVKEEAYIA